MTIRNIHTGVVSNSVLHSERILYEDVLAIRVNIIYYMTVEDFSTMYIVVFVSTKENTVVLRCILENVV